MKERRPIDRRISFVVLLSFTVKLPLPFDQSISFTHSHIHSLLFARIRCLLLVFSLQFVCFFMDSTYALKCICVRMFACIRMSLWKTPLVRIAFSANKKNKYERYDFQVENHKVTTCTHTNVEVFEYGLSINIVYVRKNMYTCVSLSFSRLVCGNEHSICVYVCSTDLRVRRKKTFYVSYMNRY